MSGTHAPNFDRAVYQDGPQFGGYVGNQRRETTATGGNCDGIIFGLRINADGSNDALYLHKLAVLLATGQLLKGDGLRLGEISIANNGNPQRGHDRCEFTRTGQAFD